MSRTLAAKAPFDLEPTDDGSRLARAVLRTGDALRLYHRHEVIGVERIARAIHGNRPVILVGNHSMGMVDALMFATAIQRSLVRVVRFMAHEMAFFRLAPLRRLASSLGMIPSRHPDVADELLRRRELLMLYPGAGVEAALRSYRREPYGLKWYGRLGFVELALRHRARLFFVAGVGIDEMFYQTDVPIPRRLFDLVYGTYLEAYRGVRLQVGAAGLEIVPGVFPLPVRVTHVISPQLPLDYDIDPADRKAVEAAQIRLWAKSQRHLDRAVDARRSDALDAPIRRSIGLLQWAGV